MNLYKIKFIHYSPKDSQEGLKLYFIGNSDEEVYEFIKFKSKNYENEIYVHWDYYEKDNETFEIYNDNYEVIGVENFKEHIIKIKGDMNDENYELTDLYYGKTLYGWELVEENIDYESANILLKLGIAERLLE